MKVSKKQAITASLVLLVFAGAVFAYYLISRDNFTNPVLETNNVEDEHEESKENTEENAEKEEEDTPVERTFDFKSDSLNAKNSFTKVKVIWDSLNSKKDSKEIYIRTKSDNTWGDWSKYILELDPATRNSTYTTGEISLKGEDLEYAFDFNSNELIKGLLITLNGSEEFLVDEVKK